MIQTADLIIDFTIEEFSVTLEEFLSSDTSRKFAIPRAAAAVLLDDMTTMKRTGIALTIGRRPNTTAASNAISRGKREMALDEEFALRVKSIKDRVLAENAKTFVPVVKSNEPSDPPDVVEMRRMIESGTERLRLALLREREVVE